MFFRYQNRRQTLSFCFPIILGKMPQNLRKFQSFMYWGKRHRSVRQAHALQGNQIPPNNQRIYGPRRRFHPRRWDRWGVYLRRKIQRRKFPRKTHQKRIIIYGKCWTQYQRELIFHYFQSLWMSRRQAHGFWRNN